MNYQKEKLYALMSIWFMMFIISGFIVFSKETEAKPAELLRCDPIVLKTELKYVNEEVIVKEEIQKEEPKHFIHTVVSGDTLSELAELYLGDDDLWVDIQKINDNINPMELTIGLGLKIPGEKPPVQPVSVNKEEPVSIKEKDLYLLAKIINAEAGSQPYEGKVAVGNVVMNRVESPNFPDTIRGVIYQKGQFSPVSNGSINKKPNSNSIKAAKEVMNGYRVVDRKVLYFYNPDIAKSKWIFTREVATRIGGHAFSY